MPLPWGTRLVRTQARVEFARGAIDFDFTWDGDVLYESLTELGRPYPLILPLAPLAAGAFTTFDLVTHQGVAATFDSDRSGLTRTIRVGPSLSAAIRVTPVR